MKVRMLVIAMLFFFSFQHVTLATNEEWNELNRLSDEILSLVQQERNEEAKKVLEQFSDQFARFDITSLNMSVEDLRILTICHEQVIRSIESPSSSIEGRVQKAIQFRLLVDALQSEHQPMWTEMEDSIMTSFSHMKETLERGESEYFEEQFHDFLNKYDMILPSAQVDIRPEYIQRVDSHLSVLGEYKQLVMNDHYHAQQMQQMELDLRDLFTKMKEDEADPSLIWVMITTGSIIILTLSYVGFRKYNADKKKQTSQRELND
ncbi:sporulation protein YpjB [Metabacillus iocasae]|uniref:Sporulation protein YpjB n=1 Tax=Priestia iocasae TaxID=2291674 RepID=A0ABS2QVN8_9BACI|nr:sporulation protein YpjB [Metabacillus iocasae]MBM7703343.1 sporulation protein YpjB [Metabacillus iocasae]